MKRLLTATLAALLCAASVFSQEEAAYVRFLTTYLPLPDRAALDTSFIRRQVRLAMEARRTMPWGATVPEREFRHFVLPPRVNNEDLDDSRAMLFEALRPRLKGLSMSDAILEVNHWCHEHVTYRPTDARTLGPAATMLTAYGRCGEESVFTVAALRAVGIPARQVYTPRWAHTDDNHAWVEAWADGEWHFIGACEPEPRLDMAWFNESASRGMLMHTKVFGRYDGPEEVVDAGPLLSDINVISNYAPASKLNVTVRDRRGRPVADALVEFKLYNYAEFYTVARKRTDAQGTVSLTAGHGDMLLWATKDGRTATRLAHFGKDKDITLRLTSKPLPEVMDLDIVPPPVSASRPKITAAERETNLRRLAEEDSIRRAYEATMPDERLRGNHAAVNAFLSEGWDRRMCEALLNVLPEKDLHDISLDVLHDNIYTQRTDEEINPIQLRYVINPHIEREPLTPYKWYLRRNMAHITGIDDLVRWCRDSISLVEGQNPQNLRMTPVAVHRSRQADALGKKIFFAATARSLGWPARINEVDGRLQWHDDTVWHDVPPLSYSTLATRRPATARGTLLIHYDATPNFQNPKYYTHFTLSRLEEGTPQLLTYPDDATWADNFADSLRLEAGTYMLTSGTRRADGSVLARIQTFTIKPDATTDITLTLRHSEEAVEVIGALNAENMYLPLSPGSQEAATPTSLLATCGRGYYALAIIAPGHEPSDHVLRDIATVRNDFEAWGRGLVLLFEGNDASRRFDFEAIASQLPATTSWGIDADGHILDEACREMHLNPETLPVVLICDSFNRVVFAHQGYTIGLGEQMARVIRQLSNR